MGLRYGRPSGRYVGAATIWAILLLSSLYVGNHAPSTSPLTPGLVDGATVAAPATSDCPKTITPGYAASYVGPIPASFTLSPTLSLTGSGAVYVGVGVLGGASSILVSDNLGNTFTYISYYNSSWTDEGALFYHDYSKAESDLTISVVFSGGTGNHAVAIAIPIVGTNRSQSLDAVGPWVAEASASSIAATVTTPRAGDTVILFPFDTIGITLEQGLPSPGSGLTNVPNAGASTYASLWEGNLSYGYESLPGAVSASQSGGVSGGSIFAIAIAVRPLTGGCVLSAGPAASYVGPIPATFTLSPSLDLTGPGAVFIGVGVLGGASDIRVSDNFHNEFNSISFYNASWGDEGAIFYHDYGAGHSGLTITVEFSGGTGNHAVAIAFPIAGTYRKQSLDAVGAWTAATSAFSITANVTLPRAGDTVLLFPFDTVGITLEQGLSNPSSGFTNVLGGGASTYAELWQGNDSYGYEARSGPASITQSGGASDGNIFAIAIALRR